MKSSIGAFILVFLILSACKNKQPDTPPGSWLPGNLQTVQEVHKVTQENIEDIFGKINVPREIDVTRDISGLSLSELKILRYYPYAIQGMFIDHAEIYSFFQANTTWYDSLVYALWDKGLLLFEDDNIQLPEEQKEFVDAIDKRIGKLTAFNYDNSKQPAMAKPENIINLFQFKDTDEIFMEKLRENNFVITTGGNVQLFHVYEENDYRQIPGFITTDLMLQTFHMYFSYILKSLEIEAFMPALISLCEGLYNESVEIIAHATQEEIKEIALYNSVYYAIPYYFLTGNHLEIPENYRKSYEDEISFILKQEDEVPSLIFSKEQNFPYSLFKPRGHYSRNEKFRNYFRAMMWLQMVPFCREYESELKHAVYTAVLLNETKTGNRKKLMDLYQSVYEPVVFLIGLPDNLSVMDIALFFEKEDIRSPEEAFTPENLQKTDRMLVELAATRNEIQNPLEVGCVDKINFMPQRYLIDNDVLQTLVDITPDGNRPFPRGLDVFSVFGSIPATGILNDFYKEEENWSKYTENKEKMKEKFRGFDKWNYSVYNKWIESLLAVQQRDKSYPVFMQTTAWDKKNLNTSLASWAELKHDAILYGEQPMAAECGGGDMPPVPELKGYVEPNLRFWNKLSEMIHLTGDLLAKHDLLSADLESKTGQLKDYVDFLRKVTEKELRGEALAPEEYTTIRYFGSSIEYYTLSVIEPDVYYSNWSELTGPDKSIAVVADIYTRNIIGCNKCGILHVGAGNVNNIYVVVEMGGYLYLTRGAVFSYYEFVQPIGTRLTDEEWQNMLEYKQEPAIQPWMKDIIIEKEPKVDDRIFYSSGC